MVVCEGILDDWCEEETTVCEFWFWVKPVAWVVTIVVEGVKLDDVVLIGKLTKVPILGCFWLCTGTGIDIFSGEITFEWLIESLAWEFEELFKENVCCEVEAMRLGKVNALWEEFEMNGAPIGKEEEVEEGIEFEWEKLVLLVVIGMEESLATL